MKTVAFGWNCYITRWSAKYSSWQRVSGPNSHFRVEQASDHARDKFGDAAARSSLFSSSLSLSPIPFSAILNLFSFSAAMKESLPPPPALPLSPSSLSPLLISAIWFGRRRRRQCAVAAAAAGQSPKANRAPKEGGREGETHTHSHKQKRQLFLTVLAKV